MFFVLNKNGAVSRIGNLTQMTGEKIPGDLDNWSQFSTDPNSILRYSYNLLSERSVTLYHTHPPVTAAVEKHTQYAIGPGLVFRSQPDWEILEMTQVQAKDWGMKLQKLIHYAFLMLNFYEKQSVIFRTAFIQGDSLLLFDRKEPIEGLPFDLIETGGDQIAYEKDKQTADAEQIRLGIQTDKYLRRKGIWLVNGKAMIPYQDENGFQNLIQFFERKIARQLRGYPLAYRIISAAKNNDRLWDATLQRAAIEATILGVEKGDLNDVNLQMRKLAADMKAASADPDISDNSISTTSTLTTEGNVQKVGPGNILSLQKDGDFSFLEMKTPSNNFDKLQNAYYELVGMGTNTPPEVVKSLYSTSYTAHKGAFNDFIKAYMKERNTFISIVGYPVVRELAMFFISNGLLEMPNKQFFNNPIMQRAALSGKWLGPVPGVINPQQEAAALELQVKNAFMLRSDAAAQYENEWDNFIEEWEQEEMQFRKVPPVQQAAMVQKDVEDDKENSDDENDKENKDKEKTDEGVNE
jgi:capsid protein